MPKPQRERAYTDPPGMPEDERMTAAEFRIVREFLGLTGDWLAQTLKVNPRTVRDWEQGRRPIPDRIRIAMEELEARTGAYLDQVIPQLLDMPEPTVRTFRNDAEFRAVVPDTEWPASWHRMVCARVALEVPGLSIVYGPEGGGQ